MTQRLLPRQLPLGGPVLTKLRKKLSARHFIESVIPPAPIDCDVSGSLEKKRAKVADGPRLIQTQEAYISFLRNFPRLVAGPDAAPQEAKQGFIVFAKQTLDHCRARFSAFALGRCYLIEIRRQSAQWIHRGQGLEKRV